MAPNVSNVEHADMHDFKGLVALARALAVEFVLPGPGDVVVEGIADVFEPAAAKLKWSKTLAKDFMRRDNIPTAEYRNFNTYEHAREYLSSINHRVVIKVSGLAARKEVVLLEAQEEAQRELREMMVDKKFGHQEVVIQEFLSGDEISVLAFCDGHTSDRCHQFRITNENSMVRRVRILGAWGFMDRLTLRHANRWLRWRRT
ncbi:phosphoribosylamine-glycine ligase [Verticillium alfalfae VaMs.102]|uniref:Phosphoribosylamine-glycine ligase n=1 Tax=Verticillium alfalfae (strain VaMs.102 / ATCC MYA-4576 / FGSC 10136) TaxID=526221 RepID=C9S8I7_VERA1|nr:phosphoribosylamine-glycine ligase [Verticillium alfalfae VaMs.102]EEY13948.1 phosphoribosylamine-glycine ligase [Verticillium alfalfae VaMs.102]